MGFYGSNDPTNSVKALKEQTDGQTGEPEHITTPHSPAELAFVNKTRR